MQRQVELKDGWHILQDVHDVGERLELYKQTDSWTQMGAQLSEWEELPELKHLQLVYAKNPYYGRELRYFNQAPWWYKKEFELDEVLEDNIILSFTNVDYYAKVWLNGNYVGEHEGYSAPFSFPVKDFTVRGKNTLIVRVSAPWDEEVECDEEKMRTLLVRREMVKGTYEHSDTFIQRDVNPIGIYGSVALQFVKGENISKQQVAYTIAEEVGRAVIHADCELTGLTQKEYHLQFILREQPSGLKLKEKIFTMGSESDGKKKTFDMEVENIYLWHTWDHGKQSLYQLQTILWLGDKKLAEKEETLAFRKVRIERDAEKTLFYINGNKFYVRGTSYFPDIYLSAMTRERYWRDLLSIKAAGFNLVRVHVHVEREIFYDLCDQLGIAVIQDSEYNWTHPVTDEWADRFVCVFKENIEMLKKHPSIICWIGMNEPGCVDPDGETRKRFMEVNPGPRLYREISDMDPDRPMIKGSFCENDPYSGDSHNYLGSLSGGEYKDIFLTKEKLNTEYGFDAPASLENLKKDKKLYTRLKKLECRIDDIQEYQYKLLKYYTEHYRIQKYSPCSGYIQFMFIDLCPQSFYGLYDWWGIPKIGLQAMLESNMPIGVFAEYNETLQAVYAVNDSDERLPECRISWTISEMESGECLLTGEKTVDLEKDSVQKIEEFGALTFSNTKWNLKLKILSKEGKTLAENHYEDLLHLLPRVEGHPERMSHEFGMRLYWG